MTPTPPYRAALVASLAVLAGYVFSLAPSVTFWDAGEFIASMKILGIPHPPGTPLFILLGHVWATLVPFGEFAWRTNLMSAAFSAGAAGFWFLNSHEALLRMFPGADAFDRRIRLLGAGAAAMIAAFGFTNWQNSNETEVYAVASFIIGAVTWLCFRWRGTRATEGEGVKSLLLLAYLLGMSIANHLLALLAGPAVIAFLIAHLRESPSADPATRQREWARAAVFAAIWLVLLGVGLGNTMLVAVGAVAFVACAVFAFRAGTISFAALTLVIALIGVTPYLFLYLRSPQAPFVNEAAPGTWDALLAVIRRDQYPPRSPLDDPTFSHGPENPGRNITIIGLQALNYLQYFDWQWARTIGAETASVLRVVPTVLFFWLGLRGLLAHRRADRSGWWLWVMLWAATGIGLMAYMNFKPGFSLGWDKYPQQDQHEVRERDYFFVISFVVWGCWAGLALAGLARAAAQRLSAATRPLAFATFAIALIPPLGNYAKADRARVPDARLAGDFAYNLLNSVPPYGILFTFGDNDTFPLWWAQEVAGYRQDVRVVCLALARTDWYMRQLRDNPERDFDPATAAPFWRDAKGVKPTWPLHTMTDENIAVAVPQLLSKSVALAFGPYQTQLDSNTVVYTEDIVAIRIIQNNFGRRTVVWGLTSGGKFFGLDPLLVQRGVGLQLDTIPPDTSSARMDFRRLFGAPLDVAVTEKLIFESYRYADLLGRGVGGLENTSAGIAQTMSFPFTQLAFRAEERRDTVALIKHLDMATRLSANPALAQALEDARNHRILPPESTLPNRR